MENRIVIKQDIITKNNLSTKDFCKNSLCPLDYKKILINNDKLVPLQDFLSKKTFKGHDPGSADYMKYSKYRFLKTSNLTENYCFDDSIIEYCKPPQKNIYPQKNDILIAVDGKGDGLGKVAIYNNDNSNNSDTIAAGILNLTLKSKLYYILGFLKSEHFKSFIDINTAQGSTMRHSKSIALEYMIPFPTVENNSNPELVEKLFSAIIKNIVEKEEEIIKKKNTINNLIELELSNTKTEDPSKYNYPKIDEIKTIKRLDTGLYTKTFKSTYNKIKNYINGYFNIDFAYIKSGSTPSVRLMNKKSSKLIWATPTDITDEGFLLPKSKISIPSSASHNLTQDAILLINRTSKGKKGEYVGISCFYDIAYYGEGHHNQGIYRIEKYTKEKKLFIVAFMNCYISRKLCGNISYGSKMKEMKSIDFSNFIIPNFSQEKQNEISKLYYNVAKKEHVDSIVNYAENELKRNQDLGIFQLNVELIKLKKIAKNLVNKICFNQYININDYINY